MLPAYLCLCLIFPPAPCWAKPISASLKAPAAGALPVLRSGQIQSGWSTSQSNAAHYLQVDQTTSKATIEWDSFDIGSSSSVHFKQPSSGTALNRIYDSNPSQIFGKLSATGSIYLINQNGILFGKGSRVNANSLVASTLNMTNEDFENGDWHFTSTNYQNDAAYEFDGAGEVVNKGTLATDSEGRIFLLGSDVTNSGTISAKGGWVALAAGSDFEVESSITATGGLIENISTESTGTVTNTGTGKILADHGETGIYGRIIRHNGLIRSMSTVSEGGAVKLVASEKIITGPNSTINMGVEEINDDELVETPFSGRELTLESAEDDTGILICHYGDITMPAGDVTMDAGDGGRVYLGPGSSIDVSGSWSTKSIDGLVASIQLNSIELRDDFLQKNGSLKGETVYYLLNEGISFGNISQALESRILSALEESAAGGTVTLSAGSGDIIVDQGASIDISGGGVTYNGGWVTTTKLVYNGAVYDISDAPDYLDYDQVIYDEDRYSEYIGTFKEGADAGTLSLVARQIAYEGSLAASATQGTYQVNETTPTDALGYITSIGTVIPSGGTLVIGTAASGMNYTSSDPVVDTIVIVNATSALSSSFDPENPESTIGRSGVTLLSDNLLSDTGLSNVSLYATTSVTTQANTDIALEAGGSLNIQARRIYHQGSISIPSGEVSFETVSNKSTDEHLESGAANPDYVSISELGPERIELASGSVISTAGEQINNRTNVLASYDISDYRATALTDGGSISLTDRTNAGQGVVFRKGAELDVSGGYIIGLDNDIDDAGDAGEINILGSAIILEGTLKGMSLLDQEGGTISLTAYEVTVKKNYSSSASHRFSSNQSLPNAYQYSLVIDDDAFEGTGFTNISLSAYSDLTVERGVTLEPSATKWLWRRGKLRTMELYYNDFSYIGSSSISLTAGDKSGFADDYAGNESNNSEYGTLNVKKGTSVTVSPGGSISLSGDYAYISGTYRAPGGTISVSADLELVIHSDARFYATGYNRMTGYYRNGQAQWETLDAGEISFKSGNDLIMEDGSLVDVSGVNPATAYRRGDDLRLVAYESASNPGRVILTFANAEDALGNSTINATFMGKKKLSTLAGASFSINHTDPNNEVDYYTLESRFVDQLETNGFETLNLASTGGIMFDGSQTVSMAEGITIDAPVISAVDGASVILNSSYVQLANTHQSEDETAAQSTAGLAVNADFISIEGDVQAAGFSTVRLNAKYDIALSDYYYSGTEDNANPNYWAGGFGTDNDLVMTAARIYPTTASDYTITAGGDILIYPSGSYASSYIPSALGSLTLEAANIYHFGYLAAPMGQILLSADTDDGRVYLGDNSVLTVQGSLSVNYGQIDEDNLKWYGYGEDKTSSDYNTLIEQAPEQSVNILAAEVIAEEGSTINIEGGGQIYGSTFVSSTSGSMDPLDIDGRYVILPYATAISLGLTGQAVYLESNDVTSEGAYVIVSDDYAFLDAALIIEYQSQATADTIISMDTDLKTEVIGYSGNALTGSFATDPIVYTISKSSGILDEGAYEVSSITAGNAGNLTVIATQTNILNGQILADAISSAYKAGSLTLVGQEVVIGSQTAALDDSFTYNSQLDQDLAGTLYINAGSLSSSTLSEINIGVYEQNLNEDVIAALAAAGYTVEDGVISCDTITIEENTQLSGQKITLIAENDIVFEQSAGISGTGTSAYLNITSTSGTLSLADNAYITSDQYLRLQADSLVRKGTITAGTGLSLVSDYLYLADAAGQGNISSGFVVDQEMWQSMAGLENLWLTGYREVGFAGQIDLETGSAIIINTPLIAGLSQNGNNLTLNSDTVYLYNTSENAGSNTYAGNTGTLIANADNLYMGYGNVQTSGFSTVNLNVAGFITAVGEGSFSTNNADLDMTAAMVTGTHRTYTDDDDEAQYEILDFQIDSGSGDITIASNGTTAENNGNIGGHLVLTGDTIINSGTLSLGSGYIEFTSTGTDDGDGVFMEDGSIVSVAGSRVDDEDYDAGKVLYRAENGDVLLAQGSVTDVSAGTTDGNAGIIAAYATQGNVSIDGSLKGSADNGRGGTFLLDTMELADLSGLIDTLTTGGIDYGIDLRIRTGDISLTRDVTARNFRLSADEGDIDIDSVIDASGADEGGLVELYASGHLKLSAETQILAMGTGIDADGGQIILGNATQNAGINDKMDLGGAYLDVSGNGGDGGSVYIRVSGIDTDNDNVNDWVNLDFNAQFQGADEITVEGVAFYEDNKIKSSDLSKYKTDAQNFMNTTVGSLSLAEAIASSASGDLSGFRLIAGVDVSYDGNMTWYDDTDFSNWRFGPDGTPVALTLRASGDIKIDGIIVDGPTALNELNNTLTSQTAQDSMNITLVAGAALSSADPFAVQSGTGDLNIDNGELVYTESGNINFASGGDTIIERVSTSSSDYSYKNSNAYMTWNELEYSLGSYAGTIRGQTMGSLDLYGGIIQTATGDILLEIQKNLYQRVSSSKLGSIRTLGELVEGTYFATTAKIDQTYQTSLYTNGGDISITVGNDLLVCSGSAHTPEISPIGKYAWDTTSSILYEDYSRDEDIWSADYADGTQGIAAMGGGNVTITAGGDVLTAAGTFGTGDLSVSAGGDLNGRYLNYSGTADISSLGNIGSFKDDDDDDEQVIEAFDSRITLTAQGSITLASIVNPSITSSGFENSWNLGYTQDTSVTINARTGSVTLTGTPDDDLSLTSTNRRKVLPGSVYISAGTNITFESNFYLAPAANGYLELYAGGDIIATQKSDAEKSYTIFMSDADPDEVYGAQEDDDTIDLITDIDEHGSSVLHSNDSTGPVIVQAGSNITNIGFVLPKAATITAENNITNLYLYSQNINNTDITLIYAGNDITFTTASSGSSETGISVGGPGLTVVQAGGDIDLGSSAGIRAVGSTENSMLKQSDNDLVVIAGLSAGYAVEEAGNFLTYLTGFFNDLLDAGNAYVNAQNNGETSKADAIVSQARQTLISKLLENGSGSTGNISLTNSRIYVSGGYGSIYMVATGDLDVGISAVEAPPILGADTGSSEDSSGIYTTAGGSVSIFTQGDINVNQSRVMTFDGGDILLWSNTGDINAGYGSKAAVASSDFYYVLQDDGTYKKIYQVPAVGSGVRATASNISNAGDIYAFAPSGIIDAGEAGIAGNNVTLAATEILNAQNIEVSGLAIGFTTSSGSGGAVTGLSGAGGLADTAMTDAEETAMNSAKDQMGEEPEGYSIEPKWVDVEVVGFESDEDEQEHS